MTLCACGCGRSIIASWRHKYTGIPRFVQGHGRRGVACSPEHKAHISESNQGRIVSAETRRKISGSNKGKVHTEESRRRMSEAQKGRVFTKEWRERLSIAARKRVYTEEERGRMRERGKARRGIPLSEEQKKKLSEIFKGRTKETHAYIRKNADNLRGRKQSPELIEKRVASRRGKSMPVEGKEKAMKSRCDSMRYKFWPGEDIAYDYLKDLGVDVEHLVPIGIYHADLLVGSDVVIEIDGWSHNVVRWREIDKRKDAFLASQGYMIFRLKKKDILKDVETAFLPVFARLFLLAS